MSQYTCERCSYSTKNRADFISHLHRKSPCPTTFSDKDRTEILLVLQQPKPYQCKLCNKSFTSQVILSRHNKQIHPDTLQMSPTRMEYTLVFGKEDIKYVEDDWEFLCNCTKNVNSNGIALLAERIWFDENSPQNMNIIYKREMWPRHVSVLIEDSNLSKIWVERFANEYLILMYKKCLSLLKDCHVELYAQDNNLEKYEWREQVIFDLYRMGHSYKRKLASLWELLRSKRILL